MGGTSSTPSRSTQLVLYDEMTASAARTHITTDFVDPLSLVANLLPGDLIQVKGNYFYQWFYSHFAVYYGNGYIIHVAVHKSELGSSCKVLQNVMVEAFQGCLVRKNNHMDNSIHFRAKPPREIAIIARSMIGQDWPYHLFTNNCEHFAALCRYGRKVSLQSNGFADIYAGHITASEFVDHCVQGVKEKCVTLVSWINRKFFGLWDSFGFGQLSYYSASQPSDNSLLVASTVPNTVGRINMQPQPSDNSLFMASTVPNTVGRINMQPQPSDNSLFMASTVPNTVGRINMQPQPSDNSLFMASTVPNTVGRINIQPGF